MQGPQGPPGPGSTIVRLNADHAAFTATGLANVTGLSFPVSSGVACRFEFLVAFRSAATTTGIRLGLTFPAATVFAGTVTSLFAADGSGALFAGALTASDDSVVSSATPAINTDYLAKVEGFIIPSANGTLQLRAATEILNSAVTVRNGSHVTYQAL